MVATKDSPPLSASAIKALEPRPTAYELADPGCPGLRLRVEPSGRRTFRWYTRNGDERAVVTIGPWSERAEEGHVTLAEARVRLKGLKAARDEGRLVGERRALAAPKGTITVAEVAEEFVEHLKRKRKTADQVERALRRDVLPFLGAVPIAVITARDVGEVVERVAKRGSPSSADHVFVHVNALLRFALGKAYIGRNPAAALDREALGAETNERARVLSDEEIAAFWNALDRSRLSPTVRAGLRLLLLLGVRTGELLRASWDELDLAAKVWTVPVDRQKVNRKQRARALPWKVPLSLEVLAQLERLRVLSEGSPYILASPQGLDEDEKPRHLTDKALVAGMRKLFEGDPPLLTFPEPRPTPHDLRRTLRTGLARLHHADRGPRVPREVAEDCLNHVRPGVEGVYNRDDAFNDRREALARWGAHVAGLVAATSNVVPIAGVRS
jgi:integrase